MCVMASCTVHPFTYTNPKTGGEVASLGGSILTKSKKENAFMKKGDFVMGYNIEGKNEVSLPVNYIWAKALESAVSSAADAVKNASNNAASEAINASNNATQVQLGAQQLEAAQLVKP